MYLQCGVLLVALNKIAAAVLSGFICRWNPWPTNHLANKQLCLFYDATQQHLGRKFFPRCADVDLSRSDWSFSQCIKRLTRG